ncbi:MAG: phosphoribosyltransferase family protein [Dysosmobacter sp.]
MRERPAGFCAAPLWYEGQVREGCCALKFQGPRAAAGPLGELVARCAAERFSGEFDVVTWVPVSRRRLRSRGYDQARLLAESACRLWEVQPERCCKKHGQPRPVRADEEAARRANVLGVYEAAEPERIQGYRILLVDDICTTGATLAECARTLRDAGAADVMCVCAALARRPDEKTVGCGVFHRKAGDSRFKK